MGGTYASARFIGPPAVRLYARPKVHYLMGLLVTAVGIATIRPIQDASTSQQ